MAGAKAAAMMTPRATYRLQFRDGFDFAAAADIAGYLARLGVSHVYASPVFAALSGSTHGYDVTDFNAARCHRSAAGPASSAWSRR
jgi:maltooligosyltrehalose synthase